MFLKSDIACFPKLILTCVYYIFIRQLRPDSTLDRHLEILIAGAPFLFLEQPFGIFIRWKRQLVC